MQGESHKAPPPWLFRCSLRRAARSVKAGIGPQLARRGTATVRPRLVLVRRPCAFHCEAQLAEDHADGLAVLGKWQEHAVIEVDPVAGMAGATEDPERRALAHHPGHNSNGGLEQPARIDVLEVAAGRVAVDDAGDRGANQTIAKAERFALDVEQEEMPEMRLE